MDYQKIAGDVLFGADVLDNSMRGAFIEAVVLDALRRHDAAHGVSERWHHIGLGWGPWDLQRGSARARDRVRVQVKTTAQRQLWAPPKRYDPAFDLGFATKDAPEYFATNFDPALIGDCEATGYRTDLFLLAWHSDGRQADPHTYEYYIVPVSKLQGGPASPKRIPVRQLRTEHEAAAFTDLPTKLNAAADAWLASTLASEAAAC